MKTKVILGIIFLLSFCFMSCDNPWQEDDSNAAKIRFVDYTALRCGVETKVVAQIECNLNHPTFKVDPPYELITAKEIEDMPNMYKVVAKNSGMMNGYENDCLTVRASNGGDYGVFCSEHIRKFED